ncbi:MAG TPA: ATP-binding protein [Spirochaetia bacterium]|nr:ATP-binding protein [Spirochaetales bacterium]HRW25470.1 ATP-binding protein [Spirochaetia bacterium]
MSLSTRLFILMLLSVMVPMLGMSFFLKSEISESILVEKRDKLFGLARQLDAALDGSYDDILAEEGALDADRETKIAVLNSRLRGITDFVASGNAGVGVGYYGRDLDAVLTYGPSGQFQYTVGQPIFQGHKGYEVMATGQAMVQTGSLVRGDILNCMWPINRDGRTIGYIWSNETLDMIDDQLDPILDRVVLIQVLIFFLIYLSLTVTMKGLLDKVTSIKKGIEVLFHMPNYHIPQVSGELSTIVSTINDLVDTNNLVKCYNKNILEGVMNGVLAVSSSGAVTRANKAFLELFPELGADFIDAPYREALGPVLAPMIERMEKALEERGSLSGVELGYGERVIEIYGSAMFDETGSRIGAVYVFRDVTTMRRYEKEIKEKERAVLLSEMALAVVHEVKNPMTSVKGFAQLLGRPGVGEDRRREYLRLIDEELNRVNRLLNEMLVYGGDSRLDPRPCDVAELVRDSASRNDWSPYGVRPTVLVDDDGDFTAPVDGFKLGQVLDNVLKNACEAVAAKGSGRVVAQVAQVGDAVMVRVVDSGVGIAPDALRRIGSPLFSTKKDGNGFGLAISRKIVEAHGGSLFVDSREGLYTKVSVFLPKGRPGDGGSR